MTTATDSDDEQSHADPWIVDGMLPIAVAHAEAAAKAAGISIGEWVSQLLLATTAALPSVPAGESATAPEPGNDRTPRR